MWELIFGCTTSVAIIIFGIVYVVKKLAALEREVLLLKDRIDYDLIIIGCIQKQVEKLMRENYSNS